MVIPEKFEFICDGDNHKDGTPIRFRAQLSPSGLHYIVSAAKWDVDGGLKHIHMSVEQVEGAFKRGKYRFAPASQTAPEPRQPDVGEVWRHRSGRIYQVRALTNLYSENDVYTVQVVHEGGNGKLWSRPLSDWHRSMAYDHTPNAVSSVLRDYVVYGGAAAVTGIGGVLVGMGLHVSGIGIMLAGILSTVARGEK